MYALTLHVPLDGTCSQGGLEGVLMTNAGRWLKAQEGKEQCNLYVSFREVRGQEDVSHGAPSRVTW